MVSKYGESKTYAPLPKYISVKRTGGSSGGVDTSRKLQPIQDVLGRDLTAPVGSSQASAQMEEASRIYTQQKAQKEQEELTKLEPIKSLEPSTSVTQLEEKKNYLQNVQDTSYTTLLKKKNLPALATKPFITVGTGISAGYVVAQNTIKSQPGFVDYFLNNKKTGTTNLADTKTLLLGKDSPTQREVRMSEGIKTGGRVVGEGLLWTGFSPFFSTGAYSQETQMLKNMKKNNLKTNVRNDIVDIEKVERVGRLTEKIKSKGTYEKQVAFLKKISKDIKTPTQKTNFRLYVKDLFETGVIKQPGRGGITVYGGFTPKSTGFSVQRVIKPKPLTYEVFLNNFPTMKGVGQVSAITNIGGKIKLGNKQQNPKVDTSNRFKTYEKLGSTNSLRNFQDIAQTPKTRNVAGVNVLTGLKTPQKPKTITGMGTLSVPKLKTPQKMGAPSTFRNPTPRTRTIIPFGFPILPFGGERSGGLGRLKVGRKYSYFPSFKALAFNIRGKGTKPLDTKRWTGLETRRIYSPIRRRKIRLIPFYIKRRKKKKKS